MSTRGALMRDVLVLSTLSGWALALPAYSSEFVTSVVLSCLMYVTLATSWALFCGLTRYLSLATSAFFGVGAYTTALGYGALGWVESVALGAGVAALLAVVMGAVVLHLRGTYFAVLTFGMTELILHAVTYYEKSVTGTVGRVLAQVPDDRVVYVTVLALAVLALAVSMGVRRSRFGLALRGIGADEQRAQTLGVNARAVKVAGFALTAAFAGATGAAMAVRWTYIDPATVFNPFIGFQTVLVSLIGGATTLWGPLIAAIVFSILAETLRLQFPQGYMMALGMLLILCVLYLPGGLVSLRWDTLRTWAAWWGQGWRRWSARRLPDRSAALKPRQEWDFD